eukprot:NODE_348_length_10403_cov_0.608210.p2 type:complete len:368 gc:universal NODE_348_length_10403_cov_0.608210:10376-9273(-)
MKEQENSCTEYLFLKFRYKLSRSMSRYVEIFSTSKCEKYSKEIKVESKKAKMKDSDFEQLALKVATIMQPLKTSQKINFCSQFESFWIEFGSQFASVEKSIVKSVLNALYDDKGRQIFGKYHYYESFEDAYVELMDLKEYSHLKEYLDGVSADYLLELGFEQFIYDIPKKHRIIARSLYDRLFKQTIYVDLIQKCIFLDHKCKSIKKGNGKMYELPIDNLGYWITHELNMKSIAYLNLSGCGLVKEDLCYLANLAGLEILNLSSNNIQIKEDKEFDTLLDLATKVSKLDVSNNPFAYLKKTVEMIKSKGLLAKYIWINSGHIPGLEEDRSWVKRLREWNYSDDELVVVYDSHVSYDAALDQLSMRSE